MLNQDLFLEIGDYFAFVYASEQKPGEWFAWVTFERKADHAQKLEKISAMRHGVKATFPDMHEAVRAAAAMAHEIVERGDVGL